MTTEEKNLRNILELKDKSKRKNYSVQAGAGAGKSTMLSTRISEQIVEGVSVDKFAIITYTNAAATELREKIINKLQERLFNFDDPLTDNQRNNVEKALNSIETMQISTIHAFLYRILRENSFESGLVMDPIMIESDDDDPRIDEFFNEWYKRNYYRLHQPDLAWEYITQEDFVMDKTREVYYGLFKAIANIREDIILDLSDHSEVIDSEAQKFIDKHIGLIRDFCQKVNDNRPNNKNGTPKSNVKPVDNMMKALENYGNVPLGDTAVELSKAVDSAKELTDNQKQIYRSLKYIDTDVEVTSALEMIAESLTGDVLEDDFGYYYKYAKNADKISKSVYQLLDTQKEFQKYIDSDARYISNEQILIRAYNLFSTTSEKNNSILKKIRDKYTKIYVDEFQDTTALQTKIIKLLCQEVADKPNDDMLLNTIPQEKLLVVGDPKQSIYRFTGAEKIIFDNLHSLMSNKERTEAVVLQENFRSNNKIVDWVNSTFADKIDGYEKMTTEWVAQDENSLSGVYRLVETDDDKIELVKLINKLVSENSPYSIEEYDRKTQTYRSRPIIYSDIMVITRVATSMSDYVLELAKNNIPVNLSGKIQVDHELVLRNYVSILKYLACSKNISNEIEAAKVLKDIDITSANEDTIDDIKNELNDLYEETKELSATEVAEYVLTHENLYMPKYRDISVQMLRIIQIRLHQMVEKCIVDNNGNLSHLVDLMNDYLQRDVEREVPLESNENAIRFMNVHKSKGLTANIVIIANNSFNDSPRLGGYKRNGCYYPSVNYSGSYKRSENFPVLGWNKKMIIQAANGEIEEKTRLEYVAATRAAHALILMPSLNANSWFNPERYDWESLPDINTWLDEHENMFIGFNTNVVTQNWLNLDKLAKNKENADISSEAVFFQVTPSSLEKKGSVTIKSKKKVEEEEQDAGEDGQLINCVGSEEDEEETTENRPKGKDFGTIMHRVYELLFNSLDNISPDNKEAHISRIIRRAILEQQGVITEEYAKQIFDYLKKIFSKYYDSVIMKIAKEADEIYTELPFSFWGSDEQREAIIDIINENKIMKPDEVDELPGCAWINGIADLVVKTKDKKYRIYDYKSDTKGEQSYDDFAKKLQAKYKGQLELYKIAVGEIFGVDPSSIETELIDLYR